MVNEHSKNQLERKQHLIDSILEYFGVYHGDCELYEILHGSLKMSHEDIELLGFELSEYYEKAPAYVPDEETVQQCSREFAQAEELITAAGILINSGSQFAGIASFLCYQSAYQMMCAFIDLRSLEILDDTGFTQDYWDTCVEAAPQLTQMDEPAQALLDLETASRLPGDLSDPYTSDSALQAVSHAQRLQLALLEAEPLLQMKESNPGPTMTL